MVHRAETSWPVCERNRWTADRRAVSAGVGRELACDVHGEDAERRPPGPPSGRVPRDCSVHLEETELSRGKLPVPRDPGDPLSQLLAGESTEKRPLTPADRGRHRVGVGDELAAGDLPKETVGPRHYRVSGMKRVSEETRGSLFTVEGRLLVDSI